MINAGVLVAVISLCICIGALLMAIIFYKRGGRK